MTFSAEQQRDLKVQRGIRQVEDKLVQWIQDALDNTQYSKPEKNSKNNRDKLEESQFRNLVRVSDTTESSEVVKNFLRYQVGRDRKWGRGPQSLAERIVTDIDGNLRTTAQNIANSADSSHTNEIHIELVRRYLGYGARYLKYLNDGQSI
ncbi:hypothetical protein [Almyronema epifaneia]|uniref:Uncharacterized protein n=1 Tax=Almyronema epifaneia S1 TaxID=2991925 RepID=A0ABW6IJH5_9CYAN